MVQDTKAIIVCKCCGAEGKTARGCSCGGGKSHRCLKKGESPCAATDKVADGVPQGDEPDLGGPCAATDKVADGMPPSEEQEEPDLGPEAEEALANEDDGKIAEMPAAQAKTILAGRPSSLCMARRLTDDLGDPDAPKDQASAYQRLRQTPAAKWGVVPPELAAKHREDASWVADLAAGPALTKFTFHRLVREVLDEQVGIASRRFGVQDPSFRITLPALETLQFASESMMVAWMSEARLFADHAKRSTVTLSDLRLARRTDANKAKALEVHGQMLRECWKQGRKSSGNIAANAELPAPPLVVEPKGGREKRLAESQTVQDNLDRDARRSKRQKLKK